MPCVLPVVPLKAMGFYEVSQHNRAKSLALGLVFSLGLVASFAVLGLLVVAYPPAVDRFKSDIGFIPLNYDPAFISSLASDLLLAGALLGALGSYIGVRRYVRI